MDKKLVLELQNHNVYYVKTDVVNYYITIPKNVDSTNICIELKNRMGNYDIELNDEIWVMENIKTTFSYIDNYNITLVLPVLKEEQISILEKIDNTKYEQIDKILGFVINNSYGLLKENNKKVSNEIILVNNDRYKTFINWFITKYKSRVVCKNLLELIQIFNANATSYKKLETPVMNFVVGSYNTEVEAPKIEQKELPSEKIEKQLVPQASYGYATYWILAIVTLVVSAVVAVIAFTMK
ncbi:MAG: hypothetical protein IJE89_04050 [Bacilli bacterium]|nr:hypothetical protein [Bacilli bacterium]